jgi:aminoglycoside 2''-phosphotransferase
MKMNKQDVLLQSIRSAYPDLQIVSVEFNDDGQNNDVLVVNGEFMFRFPKYADALKRLRIETAILTGIADHVSLPVPVPMFVNIEGRKVGEAFTGYRRLPGEPLWRETFAAIDDEQTLARLASQLGRFLKELHSIPAESIGCELPVLDTDAKCADLYARIREKLFSYMRPDAREWTERHFEMFLNAKEKFVLVLKHGDFGTSNILFDSRQRTICGVIDFGSSGLGDPAYDLAGLLSSYGEEFVRRCWKVYPEIESLMDRVRFYQGTFALEEALFGIENGDQAAFESGIAKYKVEII